MSQARPRLNRDAVLAAALTIIDEGGLEACTMRAVAAELGVEAMSLYWHVPNKEALLDGVIELMLAEVEHDRHVIDDWAESLMDFGRAFRRVILLHRNVLPLLASRPLGAYVAAARMTEQGIESLEEAGFDRQTAIRAARTVARYVMGFTLGERVPEPAPPPPSSSPALDALLAAVASDDPEELFEFGLETLVAGLKTRLRPA
jgi:TetR/AcrR family transcriptional regulator, tetracycline repressor protein